MNESRRKLLTKYIGEKFHPGLVGLPYTFEGYRYSNRLFENWADLGAVKETIERKGEWDAFYWEAWDIWVERSEEDFYGDEGFARWLLNPSRFGDLAGEWLEQRKEKMG